MFDCLEHGRTIHSAYYLEANIYSFEILCRRIEATTPGNRKKEASKTDSQCPALAPYVTSCHDCCD